MSAMYYFLGVFSVVCTLYWWAWEDAHSLSLVPQYCILGLARVRRVWRGLIRLHVWFTVGRRWLLLLLLHRS